MVNVSNVQLSTTVLGEEIAIPIGVSPAAAHQIAHPEGENATVRGDRALKYCFRTNRELQIKTNFVNFGPKIRKLRWF